MDNFKDLFEEELVESRVAGYDDNGNTKGAKYNKGTESITLVLNDKTFLTFNTDNASPKGTAAGNVAVWLGEDVSEASISDVEAFAKELLNFCKDVK